MRRASSKRSRSSASWAWPSRSVSTAARRRSRASTRSAAAASGSTARAPARRGGAAASRPHGPPRRSPRRAARPRRSTPPACAASILACSALRVARRPVAAVRRVDLGGPPLGRRQLGRRAARRTARGAAGRRTTPGGRRPGARSDARAIVATAGAAAALGASRRRDAAVAAAAGRAVVAGRVRWSTVGGVGPARGAGHGMSATGAPASPRLGGRPRRPTALAARRTRGATRGHVRRCHGYGRRKRRRAPPGGGALRCEIRRRPTLPGGLPPSTIGADRLNFRVRDGNGCDPVAMATEISCQQVRDAHRGLQSKHELFNPSPRPISTGRLNVLPRLHLRPINVMVLSRALLR